MSAHESLKRVYSCLYDRYGPQRWWPADEPFEVIVGAILTQSMAWVNVEKAIANLKNAEVLNPVSLRQLPIDDLAAFIKPSGYYNVKARKLKAFGERMDDFDDSLPLMFALDIPQLRNELLSIFGIGPETADSIILYAAQKPIFVIDAYTHRIMDRLGLNPNSCSYTELQSFFMNNLPHEEQLFNEYHALLVRHGKEVCKKKCPLCTGCCLVEYCRFLS